MKFIKNKNMQEGEELLYTPQLHWMFVLKHVIYALPFFILIPVLLYYCIPVYYPRLIPPEIVAAIVKYFFPVAISIVLLILVCKIFQYVCIEYGVTNKRLILKKGVFRLYIAEIPTDRIESIYCTQGILGRIFRYGTLYISGIGGRMPVFYMVARPYAFRRRIVDIIEKNKTINVVHGELPRRAAEQEVKEEPVYRYGTFVRLMGDRKK